MEKLVLALDNRAPGFKDELNNTIAIDLYYRITQGVLKGDIKTTVNAIRKYGYIFEGNASIRYFYDIDMESDPASFTFIISDFAREFNPLNSDAPDIENYHKNGQDSGFAYSGETCHPFRY